MIILPRSRWNEQPQVSSEIDWSHPSSRGLVRAVVPPFPQDLVTGTRVTFSPLEPGGDGSVAANTSNYPVTYAANTQYIVPASTGLTVLMSTPKTNPSLGAVLAAGVNGSGRRVFHVKTNGYPEVTDYSYGGGRLLPSTGPTVPANAPVNIAFQYPWVYGYTRDIAVYWNGFLRHSTPLSRDDENMVGLNAYVLASDSFNNRLGPVSSYWIWNRELMPSELVSLTNNPWQLLKQNRFVFPAQTAAVTNDLLANDLQSLSQLSTPVLRQTHGLLANDLQSLSSVSSSALAQGHALLANDLQSLSQLSTPTLGQTHVLLANDLQSTSSLSTPTVGQVHVLLADNLQSASSLSTPSVGVIRNLLADNLQSVSTVSTPAVVSTVDTLLADNLQSVSSLSVPVLRQKKQINYAASATIGSLSAITFYHNSGKWYGY